MPYRFVCLCLVLLAALRAQQTEPQRDLKRDLKIEDLRAAPKQTAAIIPRSYALVVGIAAYQDPKVPKLLYSERDAQSVFDVLISPEGGNFHRENVHLLVGSKATLANLRHELEEWLPGQAKDGDRVLIYFAGHGFLFEGHGYLAPYDIDTKPGQIAPTGYPMDELGKTIGGKIRAKDKILLTDSCHSGAIRPEDSQDINHTLIELDKSLFSLTASRDREVSYEGESWGGGHGVFTYFVVRGLEGEADENGDGVVNADELQDYVRRNVREATSAARGGSQNPTVGQASFDPQMLLAYVPSRATPGAPPAAKEGSLIFVSNMDGVEVFLDGKSVGVVNKDKPLPLPGLAPGTHAIQGVKMGYEPDGPREETVYPGRETTVSIKILIARRRNRAAADALDKGMGLYQKGYEQNYKKAVAEFQKALDLDPTYSLAALYLARAYHALSDEKNAEKYYRKAIEIDPDYLEAHASFGGMLLDIGNTDEAIRQFETVISRDPDNILALTNLAQGYRMKELYKDSIEAARKAVKLGPELAEPHLWMADSLRLSGQYDLSIPEYDSYLRLSNFDSKLAGQLNYYVLGFLVGMGKKKRAAQQDIWKDLRSLAYYGMCDSQSKMKRFDRAIEDCQKALAYDPHDPYSHYSLALAFANQAKRAGDCGMLAAALPHFRAMLQIDPDLQEAAIANQNIKAIETYLPQCP
ncbi:MAG TPA: tetratricopeptide repeat protein [Bryobacteraceae bacterium]|jgi:tetratricopeptide (TPR) repeat protein|nr:tetratricopeptide repeat protein [Bryobacteraceae bacterium]